MNRPRDNQFKEMNRPHDKQYGIVDIFFLIVGFIWLPIWGLYLVICRRIRNLKK